MEDNAAPLTDELANLLERVKPFAERTCSICGFRGYFGNCGRPPRIDALCPACGSMERHRLFWLWYAKNDDKLLAPVLHFAPEAILEREFRKKSGSMPGAYRTADLYGVADLKLDIEAIDVESESVGTVICNHVLEHVDDRLALAEIHRILMNHGVLIASVPLIEGWEQTYENDAVTTDAQRDLHFGQADHVRYYGRDFRDRLSEAGFVFEEVTADGASVVEFGLLRGEKFFICRKAETEQHHRDAGLVTRLKRWLRSRAW
ncbi:methyltransferase domain-containing protein [Paraburkholderia caballeronis]|uniref:Methyltransferase domain-containing protein n=1 Tax=Paraburkholderia caballeronis TaxID=416943 RepID=A0A1H7V2R2_9BURK|nr:methyltransferase domain-containing protein [Paraburkholderia caballeronis]PXW16861.1 methyltransferase family protein [Paraburkholderia caballeronis]PXW94497.1 methyltransferase family protein [Paraburkholderia caballeronis]RAJ89840.1 methyltransferase family protein [Paraburkholderia caballeronis]SEC66049.1 Methyltransferase domain-containing protein [Paraburkholderia caballeronis]SEM03135.1 Methyltransferase domain-containing protein [Paraburkholderia caballeronis]